MKACRCNRLHRHFFSTNNYLFIFWKTFIFLKYYRTELQEKAFYRTELQKKAILQNRTSKKLGFTDQNFKKTQFYRSEIH